LDEARLRRLVLFRFNLLYGSLTAEELFCLTRSSSFSSRAAAGFGTFAENLLFHLTLDRGWNLSLASLFFSAMNFASFSAKLIGGHVGDSFDRFHVGSVMSGVTSAGVLCMFIGGGIVDGIPRLTHSPVMVGIFSVVFGFGYGATFNALYCLVPLVFGPNNLGRIQSSLFGLGLIGNAAGSIITGVLRSKHGSYDRGFLIAGAACVANLCVFNITRMTLGGSFENFRKITRAEQAQIDASDKYDVAVAARIGGASEHGSAGVTPLGSYPRLPSYNSGFFGASFKVSPSTDQLALRSPTQTGLPSSQTSPCAFTIGEPASGEYDDGGSGSSSYASLLDAPAREGGSGVGFESGFPDLRSYSSGSLQRITESRRQRRRPRNMPLRVDDQASTPSSPLGLALLRTSSTFENLISSGIMSHSYEDMGYAGLAGQPASPSPQPWSRMETPPPPYASSPVAPSSTTPPGPSALSDGRNRIKPPRHRSSGRRHVGAVATPIPDSPGCGSPSPPHSSPPLIALGVCSPQSFGLLPPSAGEAMVSDAQLRLAVERVLSRSDMGDATAAQTLDAVADNLGTTASLLRHRQVTISGFVSDFCATHDRR
jgi:MFS family permease